MAGNRISNATVNAPRHLCEARSGPAPTSRVLLVFQPSCNGRRHTPKRIECLPINVFNDKLGIKHYFCPRWVFSETGPRLSEVEPRFSEADVTIREDLDLPFLQSAKVKLNPYLGGFVWRFMDPPDLRILIYRTSAPQNNGLPANRLSRLGFSATFGSCPTCVKLHGLSSTTSDIGRRARSGDR